MNISSPVETLLAYCWMSNQIHALLQTPEPNLASGMQHWVSGYANGYAKRNRRTGHLYQFMIRISRKCVCMKRSTNEANAVLIK